MKTVTFVTAVAFVLTVAGSGSAMAADATATATAAVVNPISIAKDQDMNFGTINANGTDGTVQLPTSGPRVFSPVPGPSAGSDFGVSPAMFTVTGNPSSTYSISAIPATSLTGPGTPMSLDEFTTDHSTPPPPPTVGGGGTHSFKVGATLHVNAPQADGIYTGTFTVTVLYN